MSAIRAAMRPLARSALRLPRTSLRARATLTPTATLAVRGYKSKTPASDPMTGEMINLPDIDPSRLKIELAQSPKLRPPSSSLIFGRTFTDHMLTIEWDSQSGWHDPEIKPYQKLELDPSSTVLHYAFTAFEGMKAYRTEDGTVRLFRPNMNMKRLNRSATRAALPTFNGDALETLIKKLCMIDAEWIPKEPGYSLYIRPTLIGTQNALGVGPNSKALLFVICSPVGPYYASGFKPVQLLATTKYVRAWPGGTGSFKLGINYAPGIVPQSEAAKDGYSQNLWLTGEDDSLTEVGTMNLFVAFKKPDGGVELVTPPLGDLILPGVTRDSVLALAKAHASGDVLPGLPDKLTVSERNINMGDLLEAEKNGSLLEVFGTGTAAVISTVDKIGYKGRDIVIPTGPRGLGPIAEGLLARLTDIQTGKLEHEWGVVANTVQ